MYGYLIILSHLNLHIQDNIERLEQVAIAALRLLDGSGDGMRVATKNKLEIHILYFNLSIM